MNDALKLLSKSLKPFGYHVRRYKAPNILKLPRLEGATQALPQTNGDGFLPDDANLQSLVIYIRTCIRESRNIDKTARITGVTQEENTRRCVASLLRAIEYAMAQNPEREITLVCLDDRSDAQYAQRIQDWIAAAPCTHEFRSTRETGQGASLYEQFALGREDNALTYFVEDDYLHEEDAIAVCWDFYCEMAQQLGTHSVIYPQEHAVLYTDHYPSYLVLGADRHWRTMRHATHTFLTHGQVVARYWPDFENTKFVGDRKNRKKGSEARTTNKLFEKIPGFSPLKPAAVHLQFEETLPPLYDWRGLWERFK